MKDHSRAVPQPHVPPPTPTLAALLAADPAPDLPGAACVGRYPTFDVDRLPGETADDHADRLALARRICLTECPVLDDCREAVRHETHPVGMWAGERYGTPGAVAYPVVVLVLAGVGGRDLPAHPDRAGPRRHRGRPPGEGAVAALYLSDCDGLPARSCGLTNRTAR